MIMIQVACCGQHGVERLGADSSFYDKFWGDYFVYPRWGKSVINAGPVLSMWPSCLLRGSVSTGGCTSTSSLVNALNRFNIDSDCVTSVVSNSTVKDHMHIEDEDDASFDNTAARTSVCSYNSTGNIKSQQLSASHRCADRKRILGMKQRLMERAMAHEHHVYQHCPFPTNELSQSHVDIGIDVGNDDE